MSVHREEILLRRFRLCRADMLEAIAASQYPPHTSTLRELAELQLVIMATEQAMADKADPAFVIEFEGRAAA